MADHITEEEQVESIKRWIKENGMSIVVPVVLSIVAYGGWEFWKDLKVKNAKKAADRYSVVVDSLSQQGTESPTEIDLTRAKAAANEIVGDFGGTMYADMSQLILARLYVDEGELEKAKSSLQAVVSNGVHPSSVSLAKARLAKVELSLKNFDSALPLVSSPEEPAYKAIYAEIRGDIHLAQGNMDLASSAYEEALVNLLPQQGGRRALIELKVGSTKTISTKASPSQSNPVTEMSKPAVSDAIAAEDSAQ